MSEASRGLTYLFILALVLVGFAYYAGANQLGKTLFAGVNMLGLTFTGRDAQGVFAGYPANAPAA